MPSVRAASAQKQQHGAILAPASTGPNADLYVGKCIHYAISMRVGIADTTFSRFDYAAVVLKVLGSSKPKVEVERYTVPGIKDLPVASLVLFRKGCDIVIACGMVGGAPIDTQCAHEASTGLQAVQLKEGKHILEVFVHVNEAKDEADLASICEDRARKHAENALMLLYDHGAMQRRAGTGRRQGRPDEGPLGTG